MSTSYYGLKTPFTSLHLEQMGISKRLNIFIDHQLAGSLVVHEDEEADVLSVFFDNSKPLIDTHWGGDEKGCVVSERSYGLDDSIQLFGRGNLTTMGKVRELDGTGRRI